MTSDEREMLLENPAVLELLKERDLEWWQALCLVDNVAPTPEAVKAWVAVEQRHWIEEEREACAREAEGECDVYNLGRCIADRIRARKS